FGTRRLNIEASVADPFATYTILNSTGLREGLNVVTIRVTPQDSVGVKDYRLNVFVQGPASENIDLTDLKVSEGVMKPDFLPIRQFYRVQVENDVESIHVKGVAGQNVVITGNGDHELKVGLNVIVIRTKALNGVTKDYQVEVNRKPSSDAQLRSLEVTGTIHSIGFRPDTYVYNNAQTFRTSLGLKPTTRHPEARVEIIGNANFVTGGKDVVIVRVTAEDGITIQDYTLNIRKLPSNDDTLKLLSLSGVHIEPEFRSGRRTYTASVTEDIRQINISAEATDPNAKLEYSVVHNLDVGKNFIDVEVIAETGKRGKYTVEITRQGSLIRDLAGISIDGEPLANFDKDKLFYELDYDFEKESIIVDVDKVDDKSSVAGDGVVALKVGTHDYPISVTSEHGEIKVYTLSVTRRAINSSELETLNVNQYPFDQPFDGAKKTYNITIDNEFDRLQLDIRTKDPKATFVVNGNSNLKIGNNKIEIVVTSSGKDKTETYVINAYKQEYGNNFL
ncbi:MAG: cadherin-like beta sandwich domain-containing protein, partial [Erysipelothrix sp.]|nr:cadherin-like beta sandwich domain-containing protein [Erysipelothrix sp.]